jgi:hypothetical protein
VRRLCAPLIRDGEGFECAAADVFCRRADGGFHLPGVALRHQRSEGVGSSERKMIGDSIHEVGVDYFFPGGTGGIGGDWAGLKSPRGVTEHANLAGRESIPGGPIHRGWRVLGTDPARGGMNRTRPNRDYWDRWDGMGHGITGKSHPT